MSTLQIKKKALIKNILEKIDRDQSILFAFTFEFDEYIGIGIDVYGSGKPEILVLGNEKTRQAMVITNDYHKNESKLREMLGLYPDVLDMTTIPVDLVDDYS